MNCQKKVFGLEKIVDRLFLENKKLNKCLSNINNKLSIEETEKK